MEAGSLLINEQKFSTSVHCFYYSSFQLSKYALTTIGIDYEEQDKQSKGQDSHFFVKEEVMKALDVKSHLAYIDYAKDISKLKRMRQKADYTSVAISAKEANNALDCASNIKNLLSKNFTI